MTRPDTTSRPSVAPWYARTRPPAGSRLFNLKSDASARAHWYGHRLGGTWYTLAPGHATACCTNCRALVEVRVVDDGPDVIGGYALWHRCPVAEWGSCPNCDAGADWIDIGAACLICCRCGHLFGFPGSAQPDQVCHFPKGHPLRKRTTDPRDPHPHDLRREPPANE